MQKLLKDTCCLDAPVLDIGFKTGDTYYIDFITPSDMSSNIMIGRDLYNRPFLAIKATYCGTNKRQREIVCTFFQRYEDFDGVIAIGTNYWGLTSGLCSQSFVSFSEFYDVVDRIKMLKLGETLVYPGGSYTMAGFRQPISECITNVLYKDVSNIVLSYV